ncbi:folylpolyglutamate synthase, mitochondrial-like isoform X1 [Falco cherrug]|uniref:folylpolyglutamate synthase, mitochondrial-like isoform X1 n=1 Tax=Falco cherrug TaxID=345164 RepID=UPI00247AA872|nr:folylpolyglutamate synthase, mitochondrial-like isoform X1 [Falco cherrug]
MLALERRPLAPVGGLVPPGRGGCRVLGCPVPPRGAKGRRWRGGSPCPEGARPRGVPQTGAGTASVSPRGHGGSQRARLREPNPMGWIGLGWPLGLWAQPRGCGDGRHPDRPQGSFQDTIQTLNTLQTNASDLEQVKRERGDPQAQLEAMQGFLERTGMKVEDPDRLNIIHVTGTKGKGSVCAFAECILRNYGLKTGFYSSPHLVQVRERIRINGQPISKEQFSKYLWLVYSRLEETKVGLAGGAPSLEDPPWAMCPSAGWGWPADVDTQSPLGASPRGGCQP